MAKNLNKDQESCMQKVTNFLKSVDFYRILPEQMTQPTVSGAYVSCISLTLFIILLLSETIKFLTFNISSELALAQLIAHDSDKIKLVMDIDIFVQCEFLTLDYINIMNEEIEDILNSDNTDIARNFKMYTLISETEMEEFVPKPTYPIEEIVEHFQQRRACKFVGTLDIARVPGKLRLSFMGKHFNLAEYILERYGQIDFTHRINRLQFGEDTPELEELKKYYAQGRQLSPFEGTVAGMPMLIGSPNFGIYTSYFFDVTPATYVTPDDRRLSSFQYSGTHQSFFYIGLSQINFKFELSPIMVQYGNEQKPLIEFIVNLCAIVGGLITVSSIIDSILRNVLPEGQNKVK